MRTSVPARPLSGEKDLRSARGITENLPALSPSPPGVVTVILPVEVSGTVAMMTVSEITVNFAAALWKTTLVAPEKLRPLMVTWVPTGPLVGLKEVITGGGMTVKSAALTAVPAGVTTLILPVVAPLGTTALI